MEWCLKGSKVFESYRVQDPANVYKNAASENDLFKILDPHYLLRQ